MPHERWGTTLNPNRVRTATGVTAAVTFGAIGVLAFYRGFFFSGFTLLQGNRWDGRLSQWIAQHWWTPWQFGSFTDLGIFYPSTDALMYSEPFLLFGVMSAPFAWVGFDPSIAFQWSLILVSAIGYGSTVALLRLGPRATWPVAIAAGLLVNFSNGMLVGSRHPQLIAMSLAPVVGLLCLLALRGRSTAGRALLGAAAGMVLGATFVTSFYVGWYLLVAGAVMAAIALPFAWRSLRAYGARLITVIAWAVVGLLPLAALLVTIYLPLLRSGASRPLDLALDFALRPQDLVTVSPTNVWWSPIQTFLLGSLRDEEFAMAPTPGLLAVAAALLVWAVVHRRSGLGAWGLVGSSALSAGFVLWVLPVKWGSFFPWAVAYEIPGAAAIRAIGRIHLAAGVLLALGVAVVAMIWLRRTRWQAAGALVMLIAFLLVVEQANTRIEQLHTLASAQEVRAFPAPPSGCSSFVLMPPFGPIPQYEDSADSVIDGGITASIDAGIIAARHSIPTWNGYSGGAPEGWDLMPTLLDLPAYVRAVEVYGERFGIEGACAASLGDRSWRRLE